MKKLILLLGILLFTSFAYSQNEFTRVYEHYGIAATEEAAEEDIVYGESSNIFVFNYDENKVLHYLPSGDKGTYVYVGSLYDGVDDDGDEYQLQKTISVEHSYVVYFQLYPEFLIMFAEDEAGSIIFF
jgi:hypothetical protein